jgi:hypothetical protein
MEDHLKVVAQLRGEIGETIQAWVLLRHFAGTRAQELTNDIERDMRNRNLWFLNSVIERLEHDAIARLAELSDGNSRNLTFARAIKSLRRLGLDVDPIIRFARQFSDFARDNGFVDKRNQEISHKAFVENWDDERAPIHITYRTLRTGIVHAMRTMKKIDELVYGRLHRTFMWNALRRSRYSSTLQPRVGFMIANHIHVPAAIRAHIIMDEIRQGHFHQDLMDAVVNGVPVQIYASKKWGALNLGGYLLVLEHYPLQAITQIDSDRIVVDPAWTNAPDSGPPQIGQQLNDCEGIRLD